MATKKKKLTAIVTDKGDHMMPGTKEDFEIGRKMARDGVSFKVAQADKREGVFHGFLFGKG